MADARLIVEFSIKGPPVSLQTKSSPRRRSWKLAVAAAARARLPADFEPFSGPVSVRITYFYDDESPDVDNIIKPIQDALTGLVYLDDAQVEDTGAMKRSLDGSYRLEGASPTLLDAFVEGEIFLYVRVSEYVDSGELHR